MKANELMLILMVILLSGCGSSLGSWERSRDVVLETNTGREGRYETVVKDSIEYQIEHSRAHPAISWPVGPNRLAAIENGVGDHINYGAIDTLQGTRYTFVKECEGEEMVFHPSVDSTPRRVTFRLFEYTDRDTIYILRDVDMNGRKFKTHIVVSSWQRPPGNYSHSIVQGTNDLEEISYCQE